VIASRLAHARRVRRALALTTLLLAALHASVARADDAVATGHKLFKDEGCPQCHGFGGKGDGYLLGMLKEPVQMHDWTDAAAMQKLDDEYLFEITKKGGEPLGKNKVMLKYGHKLSDQQIRDIVAYIRSLAAPGASEPTPADAAPSAQPAS
jgi:mono/diheme cytochrome c family protein